MACVAERSPGEILHLPDKAEDYYHLLFEKKVEVRNPLIIVPSDTRGLKGISI